jgi:hypothetical protein
MDSARARYDRLKRVECNKEELIKLDDDIMQRDQNHGRRHDMTHNNKTERKRGAK